MTHTPGPWRWSDEASGVLHIIADVPYAPLARVNGIGPTSKANARLIAMSPRMYDYVATRASLGDNEAKQIVEELGYAEGETTNWPPGGYVGPPEQDAS